MTDVRLWNLEPVAEKPMKQQASIEIDRPIDEVFQ